MKNRILTVLAIILSISTSEIFAQSKQLSLTNGDGWYRIISGTTARGGGMVRIYGTVGNNRQTLITMNVSLMRFGQGGSINITDNVFYNTNHVDLIRGGSVNNQEYVLDIHFVGINNPTDLWVEVDGQSMPILDDPIYNPTAPDRNIIEISGRVIGVCSKRWPIYFDQNVGIGTDNPKSKLAVNGQIRATEVKVLADLSVPDYVFESGYELRTLKETKKYISENKHLPEIPSANEIAKNGIDLGDMNMRLLKKIEELTLYQIELIEQLEQQNAELQIIKKELQEMKNK
ncbi:hypothetical protein [Flammeovirga sp. OC4]|uniref:hypothetical protein n=1 Tax=Flammeovirga sp. OC4 TaxID=1382345 RepID=UPI0006947F09|nr:hypothetical protein [Flammeovirga sp. OC4]